MAQVDERLDQAELARLGHVTRARLTQIMNLLHLAPECVGNPAPGPPIVWISRGTGSAVTFAMRHYLNLLELDVNEIIGGSIDAARAADQVVPGGRAMLEQEPPVRGPGAAELGLLRLARGA